MIQELKNFGENNFSYGMELVILKVDNLEEVLKSENYFLNPSAQWDYKEEGQVFAVKGTAEQYASLYKSQKEAQIAKKMCEMFGYNTIDVNPDYYDGYRQCLVDNYKDWWE